MDPALQWTLAVIAGGGAAAVTQSATTMTRAASTATTGGLANPAVSTVEVVGASVLAGLALFWPYIAIGIVGLIVLLFITKLFKKKPVEAGSG